MSNVETRPAEALIDGRAAEPEPVHELLPGRDVPLGGVRGFGVSRTLPHRSRRMVGAWCFVDQYGPHDTTTGGMRVPPHPHTGLQTVSWLVQGDILHRDSLGSEQLIRPGQLNLMTAGRGIAHSEESPVRRVPVLQGVQLWVALPDAYRSVDPAFDHHAHLPVLPGDGVTTTVIMGEVAGVASPARTYSPLVGAQIALTVGAHTRLPLRPEFEYAALVLDGAADVDGVALAPRTLLYLGRGRHDLELAAPVAGPGASGPGAGALVPPTAMSGGALAAPDGAPAAAGLVLLLGGEPFAEQIVMWWNFVGRSHEEIGRYRAEWLAGDRFGSVPGFDGDPLPAPPMPVTPLVPRGAVPPRARP